MRFSLIPLALILLMALEIGVFIVVGGRIGVLPTLGLIGATALAGALLLRSQGSGALRRLRLAVDAGRMPAGELADGAMVLAAGVLLLLPGFLTDLAGLALFLPPVRRRAWRFAAAKLAIGKRRRPADRSARPGPDGRVLDLEPEEYRPSGPPSGSPWRH